MRYTEMDACCPYCEAPNQIQAPVKTAHAEPVRGDLSLCWSCKQLAVFDGDPLAPRIPTLDERTEIDDDAQLQRMLRSVLLTWAMRN